MQKEIKTYSSMNRTIKQETAKGNALRLVKCIAAIAALVCFILAALTSMQGFINRAEASSMRHGYCLVEDAGIWKKIEMLKKVL